MRSALITLAAIALWASSLQGVASMPLKALVQDGYPQEASKIKEGTEVANQQIKNMQAVLNGPNPKAHPAVVKAFGTDANIDAIKDNVNNLESGKFKVLNPAAASGITQGATNINTKDVSFGSAFYSSDAKTRAGTIIHEASHALNGAVDHFDEHGNPHPQGAPFDKAKAQVGYKDSHMDQLKVQASQNMHHNADSYRVFGEECPEARELFERALQEEDLYVRSHLVRRAGKACAYRPRGKEGAKAKTASTNAHTNSEEAAKRQGSKKPKAVSKVAGSRRPGHTKKLKQ